MYLPPLTLDIPSLPPCFTVSINFVAYLTYFSVNYLLYHKVVTKVVEASLLYSSTESIQETLHKYRLVDD